MLAATATASSQELVEIIYIDNGNHQLQAGGDCCQQYGGSGAGGDYLLLLNLEQYGHKEWNCTGYIDTCGIVYIDTGHPTGDPHIRGTCMLSHFRST